MSRKKSIRSAKYYSLIVSLVCGLAVSALVFFICSLALSMSDLPYAVTVFMGMAVVASGGYAAGRSFGKRKRRKGIKCGVICALFLTGMFAVASLVFTGGIAVIGTLKKALLILLFSVAGGISGVNTKIRKPPA